MRKSTRQRRIVDAAKELPAGGFLVLQGSDDTRQYWYLLGRREHDHIVFYPGGGSLSSYHRLSRSEIADQVRRLHTRLRPSSSETGVSFSGVEGIGDWVDQFFTHQLHLSDQYRLDIRIDEYAGRPVLPSRYGEGERGRGEPRTSDGQALSCAYCRQRYTEGRAICWKCFWETFDENKRGKNLGILTGRGGVVWTLTLVFAALIVAFIVTVMNVGTSVPGELGFWVFLTGVWVIGPLSILAVRLPFSFVSVKRPLKFFAISYGVIFLPFWIGGAFAFSPTWPVGVWQDVFAKDFVFVDAVENKRFWDHTHCSEYSCYDERHYGVTVSEREYKVNRNIFSAVQVGELVEIAYKPLTKILVYLTYGVAAGPSDPNAMRIAVGLAKEERRVFEEIILPEWEEQSGTKVEFVQISSDLLNDVLKKPVGRPFDLLVVDNRSLAALAENRLVQDLSGESRLIPESVWSPLLSLTRFAGRTYFLPYRPNVRIVYYNAPALERAGVPPPTTWNDLKRAAQLMRGRVALAGFEGPPRAVTITELIWQAGGDPMILNDAGSALAFLFLKEIYQYLNEDTLTARFDTMNEYLIKDSVYLAPNWTFGVDAVVVDAGKTDVRAYPGWSGPHGKAHVLGGDMLAVPTNVPNRERSVRFAEFLLSRNVQSALANELFWPPMRSDALKEVPPELAQYWDAITEAMGTARARPTVSYWGDIEGYLNQAWNDIVLEEKDVWETLNRYAKKIRDLR